MTAGQGVTQVIAQRAALTITIERPVRPEVRGGGWERLEAKVVNYDCDRPWIVLAVTEDGDSRWLSIGENAAAAAGFATPLWCYNTGRAVTITELNEARDSGRPVVVDGGKPFTVLRISGRHASGITPEGERVSYYLSWGPFWGDIATAHLGLCHGCPDCGEARP